MEIKEVALEVFKNYAVAYLQSQEETGVGDDRQALSTALRILAEHLENVNLDPSGYIREVAKSIDTL
jgi:hypothetical protein